MVGVGRMVERHRKSASFRLPAGVSPSHLRGDELAKSFDKRALPMVHVPRGVKRWRLGEARRAFVASAAALLVLASCGGGSPTAPSPVPRTGQTLAPDQLARSVAQRLVSGDFIEPVSDGLTLDVRGDLLFVKGVIDRRSYRETSALLDRSPSVRTAVLTMVPGSIDDETNFALGRMLRAAGITTYLPARGLVASGGTDLFLAGVRRIAERGARVGVHSWASDSVSGDDIPRDDDRHRVYLQYYRDIGIAEAFYWFTLKAAPPEGVHWMTEAEMARYAVYTVLL